MSFQAETRCGASQKTPPMATTPALATGEVVVIGSVPMVAEHAFEANATNVQLAIGGGTYKMVPDAAMAAGKPVWWDNTAKQVTETASGNTHFGFTVAASYNSDGAVDVHHAPQGVTGAIV